MYSLPCHHESTCHVVIRLCWRAPGLGVSCFFWLLGPCSREAEQEAKVLPGRLQMKRQMKRQRRNKVHSRKAADLFLGAEGVA